MTRRSFGVGVVIVLGFVLRLSSVDAFPPGYSYSKFSGPVSPPEHEIIVKGEHGEPAVDYVAHPNYHFEYGVDDAKSNVRQSRKEARDGDVVIGEYTLVEPNGSVRTVKYRADKEHGFQAQVYMDGKLVEHGATSGSDESGEYRVSHTGRSSEEGGRFQSDEDFVDDDGDDDDGDDDEDDD